MAKKKQDNKLIFVSVALALVVALFLFGGQITGKGYTSTLSWTVVSTTACNVLNTTAACTGSTLALGSTNTCVNEVLLENTGNNAATVTLKMAALASSEIGGTSPYIEANTIDVESGSSTENNINLTATAQTIATSFGFATSADLIGNNFTIFIPADASVSGSQNTLLTYACA